jgi:hypothetical protein
MAKAEPGIVEEDQQDGASIHSLVFFWMRKMMGWAGC